MYLIHDLGAENLNNTCPQLCSNTSNSLQNTAMIYVVIMFTFENFNMA